MFLEKMTKSRKRVFSLLDVCIMSQKCQENKVASKTREKNFVFEKKGFFSRIFQETRWKVQALQDQDLENQDRLDQVW
jgi:hypothetical protein